MSGLQKIVNITRNFRSVNWTRKTSAPPAACSQDLTLLDLFASDFIKSEVFREKFNGLFELIETHLGGSGEDTL